MSYYTLLTYTLTGCIVIIPALCSALGQAYAGAYTAEAINEQPKAAPLITRGFIVGAFLNETAAILALVTGGGILTRLPPATSSMQEMITLCFVMAIVCTLALPASLVGLLAARPHRAAIAAISRQPLHANRIMSFMMFILPMIQIAVIFGLVLSIWLNIQASHATTTTQAVQILASGVAFGLGTVGPLIGMTRFTTAACSTMGTNPETHNAVASLAFLSQALIETPILFALGVALFISTSTSSSVQYLASACAMGLSTLGPGLAAGTIATAACVAMSIQPKSSSALSYVSMLSQTFVDASALYGVIIAVALLLV